MAVFSRDQFEAYEAWLAESSGQLRLYEGRDEETSVSRSPKERFEVLRHFDEACKEQKLGVSLKTKKGLWTPDPKNPINFWIYEPQHLADKAPTTVRP